jgi:cardiolipin synthase
LNYGTQLIALWPAAVSTLHLAGAIWATIDAILRKRTTAAVIAWVGVIWLAPIVGPLVYLGFGINRVQRRGVALDVKSALAGERLPASATIERHAVECIAGSATLPSLARLGEELTGRALAPGNRIELLRDGDESFPAMLAAIDDAERSIGLLTYIFDSDRAGEAFFDALRRALARGVDVRVLVDDLGAKYSRPSMLGRLRRAGIPTAQFLPTRKPGFVRYANLRNHRKVLVVDGRIGFTGGTNIREDHWFDLDPKQRVSCTHFRLRGPIVAQLQQTFASDWAFTTGERLVGTRWFPSLEHWGDIVARGVTDGPDEDLDKMPNLLIGALGAAQQRVAIITPYFLPDDVLLRALQVTAMRGIAVDIIVPARTNFRIVDWAMRPQMPFLLAGGCRVHLTPPPFDHSKLMVVDDCWTLIGSTNWDARSLRLNFEYNVECYGTAFAAVAWQLVEQRIAAARRLDLDAEQARALPLRLRDGVARLFSPYL